MHPHSLKYDEYAAPPLGLLHSLTFGDVSLDMREAVIVINNLNADLDHKLAEHKDIVKALKDLT